MEKHPPKRALQFLRWFCREDFIEEIEGDLTELFEKQYEDAPRRANWAFFWRVLHYFRPEFIKSFKPETMINPGMIRHNLVISYRGFLRNKTAFLINLIGLSTGLACVLMIYLWVNDELYMDKFHEKDSQLYQVMHNLELAQGISTIGLTPVPLSATLAEEMPEVEYAVSVNDFFNWRNRNGIIGEENNRMEAKGLIAGEDFFHVFSYDLIRGKKDQVLGEKNSIVISESLAQKLFNKTDSIIGKALEWEHKGFNGVFQISGIFADPPVHSTEQFDLIFNLDVLIDNDQWANSWNSSLADTYVVLKEGTDISVFNQKIAGLLKEKDPVNEKNSLFVQQYSKQHLFGQYENGKPVAGRIVYVRLFSIIALFILLIACINFMNLSTAQASKKMKEIGVKKAIGANRRALIFQFLGESLLVVFSALIIACVFVNLLLPEFNAFTGKHLYLKLESGIFLPILGIALFTGLIAGSYPAFYLSGFNPLAIIKGRLQNSVKELWLRQGLVVFQFSMSLIFIVGLFVINQQIEYVQNKNLSYDRDNMISFPWKGELYDQWNGLLEGKSNENFYSFMSGLEAIPGVVNATNMSGNILNEIYGQSGISWKGEEEERNFSFRSPIVGYNFMETLGIEIIAGRSFSKERQDDYSKIILNEAAVKKMELDDPVGQVIQMNRGSEIIGVVKDFHYGSLYNDIEPLIFRCDPHGGNIMIKIQAGTEKATIEKLASHYNKFLPGYAFDFTFMDDDYQALYEAENKISVLSKYFGGLAILISCLGLFGLAAFTAERRTKEIGIRKVLGASVFSIIRMLTSDFTKTVILAIFISLPISYLLASKWLNNFAFSIDLNWYYFLLPGLAVLLIAWATVSLQTFKAARVNPVHCLKDE